MMNLRKTLWSRQGGLQILHVTTREMYMALTTDSCRITILSTCQIINPLVGNISRITRFESHRKSMARVEEIHKTRSEASNKSRTSGGNPTVLGNSAQRQMH